jgi:hypothetical protein
LDELGDGLAMVAGDAGGEVLGRLDASGGGFDGQAGDGNGSAGTAGVRVKKIVADLDALRRVGIFDGCGGGGGNDCDRVFMGQNVRFLDIFALPLRGCKENPEGRSCYEINLRVTKSNTLF